MSISHEELEPIVKLTYDDLVLFPDDGKRHEIINGRHYMNASPTPRHQLICGELHTQLREILRPAGHTVFVSPIDVQLSKSDVVVPDLVVVFKGNDIITDTRIIGSPDLVIEILSPSTRRNDENLKLRLYEQAGIPEYWIVDPDNNTITSLRMSNSRYEKSTPVTDAISLQAAAATVQIDLTRVW
ncbi:MAG: Uma2 family endonuclease [Planctomycetaceae bacterium]